MIGFQQPTIANANNLALGCWAGNGSSRSSYVDNVAARYNDNGLNEAIDITACSYSWGNF